MKPILLDLSHHFLKDDRRLSSRFMPGHILDAICARGRVVAKANGKLHVHPSNPPLGRTVRGVAGIHKVVCSSSHLSCHIPRWVPGEDFTPVTSKGGDHFAWVSCVAFAKLNHKLNTSVARESILQSSKHILIWLMEFRLKNNIHSKLQFLVYVQQ